MKNIANSWMNSPNEYTYEIIEILVEFVQADLKLIQG